MRGNATFNGFGEISFFFFLFFWFSGNLIGLRSVPRHVTVARGTASVFDDVTVLSTGRQVCGGGVRDEQHC